MSERSKHCDPRDPVVPDEDDDAPFEDEPEDTEDEDDGNDPAWERAQAYNDYLRDIDL